MSMLKNRKKEETRYQLKKSDIDFYRMTGVFAIACIFVLLVMRMESTLIMKQASGENVTYNVYKLLSNPLFLAPLVVLLAAGVVWFAYCKIKKIDESGRLFSSTNAFSLSVYLAVFVLCFGRNVSGNMHGFFITFTVVSAIVYYVSKIYDRDFTLFSVITAVNVLAVYLMVYRFDALFVIAKLIIIALSFGAIVMTNKKIKSMKISKKRKEAFLVGPAYVSAAMGAVFMFIRFLSILPSFTATGASLEAAENSATLITAISGFAASVDLKVMFMAFLIEYIIFAIVYTLRLIRD